jgi:lysophospholipase L1-like esterase
MYFSQAVYFKREVLMKKLPIISIVMFLVITFSFSCKKSSTGPTPSPTATPTVLDTALYTFENGTLMGWGTVAGDITAVTNTSPMAYAGIHSLALSCQLSSADSGNVQCNTPLFTSVVGKLIVARLWIPADFPTGGGGIFITSGTGYVWQNSWTNFIKGAWNKLMFDPNNPSYTATGVTNQANVKAVGVQIGGYSNSTWKGTIYLDSVDLITAPPVATPTSNPPPTITPTPNSGYPSDPYIQYSGRWDTSDPTNYRADWGAVYISAKFSGTSIGIKMEDSAYQNRYQYIIDGGTPVQFYANTSTAYSLATGLANTTHTITLARQTDCNLVGGDVAGGNTGDITNFWGFTAADGTPATLVAPNPKPSRRLEFIGDSISVGTADEAAAGTNPGNLTTNENGYMAFGPQTARLLSAEYSVIARGGLGVYHNWNETYPPNQLHALDYYKETLYNFSTPAWNFSNWQPDAVVIALGTNDTNSQWDTTSPGSTTTTAFEAAYLNLITYIEAQYPSAQILCMEPIPQWVMQYDGAGTGSVPGQTYISQVVAAMADPRVHYLQVNSSYGTPLLTSGYYEDGTTHPTIAGDTIVANQLSQQIKTIMGW